MSPTSVYYNENFYDTINEGSRLSADVVVPRILELFPTTKTLIDVGCGEGVWTHAFMNFGLDVVGVDGDYIDRRRLCIPEEDFVPHDLSTKFAFDRKFDLAVSLEVAEHLPEERADGFVEDLCNLSDVIIFSAAIPGQGGVGHVNEQWPGYWADKFAQQNYVVSGALRWEIWNNPQVENWYRQNLLVAARFASRAHHDARAIFETPTAPVWPVVHPVLHDHLRSLR